MRASGLLGSRRRPFISLSVTSKTSCRSARSRTIIAAAVEARCPENECVVLMKPNWDQDEAEGLLHVWRSRHRVNDSEKELL